MGWPLDKNFTCIICFNSQQCSQFQFTERKLEKTRQCVCPPIPWEVGRQCCSLLSPSRPLGHPQFPPVPLSSSNSHGVSQPTSTHPWHSSVSLSHTHHQREKEHRSGEAEGRDNIWPPHSQVYFSYDLNGNLDWETSISIGSMDILNPMCPKQTHCCPPTLVLFLVPF